MLCRLADRADICSGKSVTRDALRLDRRHTRGLLSYLSAALGTVTVRTLAHLDVFQFGAGFCGRADRIEQAVFGIQADTLGHLVVGDRTGAQSFVVSALFRTRRMVSVLIADPAHDPVRFLDASELFTQRIAGGFFDFALYPVAVWALFSANRGYFVQLTVKCLNLQEKCVIIVPYSVSDTEVSSFMKILGITGKSGSGKGYICARFEACGLPVIDTDAVVHALYRENDACKAELEARFGALVMPSGEIDRKKLGAIVFSDDSKLKMLNEIVHRYVADEITRRCAEYERDGMKAVLIDAPQLFEARLETKCDAVITVTAPESLRVERICARDGIPEESALVRLAHQHDDSFFEAHADFVIENDGKKEIDSQIQTVMDWITGP